MQAFEAGHDAVAPVQRAAGGLGVDVAAGHHRWQVFKAVTAQKQVGTSVGPDGAAELARFVDRK